MSATGQQESQAASLGIVTRLTRRLHEENIAYCHWKSNQHVHEAVIGETDLDILFDRRSAVKTYRILSEEGYKRFQANPSRAYPALEDFLGFDQETGRLAHLHMHYELSLGEKHLKGYRIPWERLVLSTRVLDPDGIIYIAHPEVETLLFLLRAALKMRLRDRLLALFGHVYLAGEGMLTELSFLKERIDPARVTALAAELLGEGAGRVTREMLAEYPSLSRLSRFRREARESLRCYRTYSAPEARWRRFRRELHGLHAAYGRKYTHPPRPLNRTVPCGGRIVVFLGSDGSGKSTVVREVVRWLSWKVDVCTIYHGSGDGPSSMLRLPLKLALNAAMGVPPRPSNSNTTVKSEIPARGEGVSRRLLRRFKPLWALVLSVEKRSKLKRGWRARNRGLAVICDRYPQDQVHGFNDGPLLAKWRRHPSRLLRWLARWEGVPYRRAEIYPPDLVIKLHVSAAVALQRKPEMRPEEIRRRIEAIRSLRYPDPTRIVDVDADAPLDRVLLRVKQAIWADL